MHPIKLIAPYKSCDPSVLLFVVRTTGGRRVAGVKYLPCQGGGGWPAAAQRRVQLVQC